MRRQSKPILVSVTGEPEQLQPIDLAGNEHDERWLQQLLHDNPSILPIEEIEPAFEPLIPVAMEVSCGRHGTIDNVFISPSGLIAVGEVKLWRNPEARRKVIAQTLEYISALSRMSVDQFQAACVKSKTFQGKSSLYDLVSDLDGALNEADFYDSLARNLKRGRILALVIGDGIRSQMETLTGSFASLMMSEFTFALVELGVFSTATGAKLVVPSTLAKTERVERPVYVPTSELEDVEAFHKSPDQKTAMGSINESDFFGAMNELDPQLPDSLRRVLKALEPDGVFPGYKRTLNFYREHPTRSKPFNLGYIRLDGRFETHPASWDNRHEIGKNYCLKLAKLIDGEFVVGDPNGHYQQQYITTDGTSYPSIRDFLPMHEEAFIEAMREYISDVLEEIDAVED